MQKNEFCFIKSIFYLWNKKIYCEIRKLLYINILSLFFSIKIKKKYIKIKNKYIKIKKKCIKMHELASLILIIDSWVKFHLEPLQSD